MITMADQTPSCGNEKNGTLCTVELGKLVDAQYGIYTRNRETRQLLCVLRNGRSFKLQQYFK